MPAVFGSAGNPKPKQGGVACPDSESNGVQSCGVGPSDGLRLGRHGPSMSGDGNRAMPSSIFA
jgi:hypothetical protein